MAIVLNGTTGITNDGGYTGDGVVFADTTPANTLVTDTSGNVGVGTSSPAYKLHVQSVLDPVIAVQATTAGYPIGFMQSGNGAVYVGAAGAYPYTFYTNGSERARIDSSGNLLVGTTGLISNERLAVTGSGTYAAVLSQSTNASGNHVLRCNLQQNGNNTASYFLWGNTNAVGNWFLYGNGTSSFSSDFRLKKNIETTRDGYLEDVAKLRVVKYNWRNDEEGKPRELGLIAQEVEQIFPGLVQDDKEKISEDDETRYKSLKQSVLPFILLKAIQELKAINDAQAETITALTARVAALEGQP